MSDSVASASFFRLERLLLLLLMLLLLLLLVLRLPGHRSFL